MSEQDPTEHFVELMMQSRDELYTYILMLLPHAANADEVLQKTSVVLWRKFKQFDPGTNFLAWARRTARLEVSNFCRVQGRQRVLFDDSLIEGIASTRDELDSDLEGRRKALKICLQRLSPSDRELIDHRYGPRKITAAQTAEELGRPANTVYKALDRIRKALFKCINLHTVGQGY